jgi:N-acetylmuramic acid 6-phosphate etherase
MPECPADIAQPDTEARDPRFADIDRWPLVDAVNAMLDGQVTALMALKSQSMQIASAAQDAALRLQSGGRLAYAGAGTSGRIAVQDGVELGPTFGWPEHRLAYLMAGGMNALAHSAEGAEDDGDAARRAIATENIGASDVLIGVAASGRTPFTLAAIESARTAGALTIAVANNPDSPLLHAADHSILAHSGSEVVAGSTRMKAGSAQKAVLNLLSTAIMLQLGRVHDGLMVDMVISNAKLLHRGQKMVATIANCDFDTACAALQLAQNDIKLAVLIAKGQSPDVGKHILADNHGILRKALKQIDGESP